MNIIHLRLFTNRCLKQQVHKQVSNKRVLLKNDATLAERSQRRTLCFRTKSEPSASRKLPAKSVKTVLSINRKEPSYTLEVQTSLACKHRLYTRSRIYRVPKSNNASRVTSQRTRLSTIKFKNGIHIHLQMYIYK